MTLRGSRAQLAFSALLVVGCGGGGAVAAGDGGSVGRDDGGLTHVDGGSTRRDDAGRVLRDGASPTDDALAPDASPGVDAPTTPADAGAACVPTPGSATFTGYCGSLHLAVLQHTGATTGLMLTGNLISGAASQTACTVVDTVEILAGDTNGAVVQHMTGAPATPENTQLGILATAMSPVADITSRCSSNEASDRIDTYGITITGHTDGGSFTAACGAVAGQGSWPPPLMVTCHSNIEYPPLGGNISVMSSTSMGITFTQTMLYANVPNGSLGALTSVASSMFVIPAMAPFDMSAPVMPFNSTGWMGSVSQQPFGNIPSSQIELLAATNPFPSALCPPASMGIPEAGAPLPPIVIGRMTGMGPAGAFSTEADLGGCVTESVP